MWCRVDIRRWKCICTSWCVTHTVRELFFFLRRIQSELHVSSLMKNQPSFIVPKITKQAKTGKCRHRAIPLAEFEPVIWVFWRSQINNYWNRVATVLRRQVSASRKVQQQAYCIGALKETWYCSLGSISMVLFLETQAVVWVSSVRVSNKYRSKWNVARSPSARWQTYWKSHSSDIFVFILTEVWVSNTFRCLSPVRQCSDQAQSDNWQAYSYHLEH
jgi:hypothetical protein